RPSGTSTACSAAAPSPCISRWTKRWATRRPSTSCCAPPGRPGSPASLAVAVQPPRRVVGKDVDDLAAAHAPLHLQPERQVVQVPVTVLEDAPQRLRQRHEPGELLGKHVQLADAEP